MAKYRVTIYPEGAAYGASDSSAAHGEGESLQQASVRAEAGFLAQTGSDSGLSCIRIYYEDDQRIPDDELQGMDVTEEAVYGVLVDEMGIDPDEAKRLVS